MGYLIPIDKLRLSIVYQYNKGSQVKFSRFRCFISLKIIFTLTNSADRDKMQQFVAFIWVFTVCQSTHLVKWLNIHVQLSIVAQDEGEGASRKALARLDLR